MLGLPVATKALSCGVSLTPCCLQTINFPFELCSLVHLDIDFWTSFKFKSCISGFRMLRKTGTHSSKIFHFLRPSPLQSKGCWLCYRGSPTLLFPCKYPIIWKTQVWTVWSHQAWWTSDAKLWEHHWDKTQF